MHIGKQIHQLMLQKEIAVKDMAAHCGITPGAVSNWFKSGTIGKVNLAKACELLQVQMTDLLKPSGALTTGKAGSRAGKHTDGSDQPLPSGLAMDLAWFFDEMLNERIDRTRAYNEATEAISRIHHARCDAATAVLAIPGTPEKQPS